MKLTEVTKKEADVMIKPLPSAIKNRIYLSLADIKKEAIEHKSTKRIVEHHNVEGTNVYLVYDKKKWKPAKVRVTVYDHDVNVMFKFKELV